MAGKKCDMMGGKMPMGGKGNPFAKKAGKKGGNPFAKKFGKKSKKKR